MADKTKIKVQKYIKGVLDGTIPTGEYVRFAVERHVNDLKRAGKKGFKKYRFDEAAGLRACHFFEEYLKHSKGEWAGKQFILSPWQAFIIWCLFGWKKGKYRRFKISYVEVARKNGKSTLAAGIGNLLTFADGEPMAEVYSAATKRDQAKIVHSEAKEQVRKSPDLKRFAEIWRNNINVPLTGSKFEPLGADFNTMDGLNPSGAIIDELHKHKNRGVWDVLITALGSRRQPLIFVITTSGFDENTICYEQHDHARQILEGVITDERFFAFVASLDIPDDKDSEEGDDWTDENCWIKANPNLGVSIKKEYLREQRDTALVQPASQNAFLRLHCDIWTEQDVRAIDIKKWNACIEKIEIKKLLGRACYGGLDLASSVDLAAFVLCFPPQDEKELTKFLPFFWIPKANITRRVERDRVPYDVWTRQGYITATEGDVIDYKFIKKKVKSLGELFDIKEIAYDRWGATQLSQDFIDEGFEVIPFGQGFASMAGPTKEFLKLIAESKIVHGGNPVLRWMARNMRVKQDEAGNMKPDKGKSREKIDGMVAAIMALDRAIRNEAATQKSIYETQGLTFI